MYLQQFPDLTKGAGVPGIEKPPEQTPNPEEPDVQRGARIFGGLIGGTIGATAWSVWSGAGLDACSPFDPAGCVPTKGSVLNRGSSPTDIPFKPEIKPEDIPFGLGDVLKNPTSILPGQV